MTLILLVLTALGVLFAPGIVSLIAPGFKASDDPEKFPLAVRLTRAIFPYIFLIGLSALAMGILNSLKEFTSSALGPILLNISMILAGFYFEGRYGPMALVAGVLTGGVLQLACQIPALLKKGFYFAAPDWGHTSLRRIATLLLPRALGSGLYQINVFVDSILASFERWVGLGGQSALYYSNRLFQLPLALFGVSLAQALLPTFSSQAATGDLPGFKRAFSLSTRALVAVALPAAVGLALLAEPIVRIIFERGRFDAHSTAITSQALFFYTFGLLSCCLIKILANAFYALQDTKTPLKSMAAAVLLNVILSLLLMGPLGIGGLTLASSLSATVNLGLLYYFLRKKIGAPDEGALAAGFLKALGASGVMGIFVWFFRARLLEPLAGASIQVQGLSLAGGIASSVLVYVTAAYALGMEEIKAFRKIF